MPLVDIIGGRQFYSMDRSEMIALMDERERQRARGVKWFEFAAPLPSGTVNTLTVGPEEGYVWSVKILSTTLGSAGTFTAYKASSTGQTSRLVGFNSASQTPQVMYWAANQLYLTHGQALYIVASTTLTNYYLGAEQAIAEQAWKVFD